MVKKLILPQYLLVVIPYITIYTIHIKYVFVWISLIKANKGLP